MGGDLGPSFVDTGYLPGPGPCGADLDGQVPVEVLVGAELESPAPTAVVRQELRVYADDAAVGQAFAGAVGGCGEVTDRTVELGFDAFSAPVDGGQVVVVLLSDAVISLVVTGDTTAVDPIRTATTAVERRCSPPARRAAPADAAAAGSDDRLGHDGRAHPRLTQAPGRHVDPPPGAPHRVGGDPVVSRSSRRRPPTGTALNR